MDITRKLSMRRLQIIRQNYVISSLYKVISEILLKTRKYTNGPYENQSPKCYITKSNRKTPATAKRANIFLRASGPAFHQRSTHVLTHCASSSISLTLSHATSSPSMSTLRV